MQTPDAAERAVLSSILMDATAMADVADALTPADFGVMDYGTVFGAMLACHSRGQRPDIVTVADELEQHKHTRLAGDVYTIVSDTDAWISPIHIGDYADRVIKASRRRQVASAATQLVQRLHAEPDADPVELAHMLLADVDRLTDTDSGPRMYAEVMEQFQERFTAQVSGTWDERVFRTGLHELDRKLGGGLRPGDLCYLAGRPGSGKTALALQIMHNGARRNEPVLIFSGEMSMQSLVERGFAEMSGLSMETIRKKVLPSDQYDALMRFSEHMGKMPVAIDDTPGLTTTQMQIRAQRFQRKHGLAAVFFDYIELAGDVSKEGQTQRLGLISRNLKLSARSLEVPYVALSQLNRGVESRTPPIPRMSDLRQSGSLEQDADVVLLLYRSDYYTSQGMIPFDPDKAGIADIYISKQRNGSEGMVSVRFNEQSMTFANIDDPLTMQRKAS